MNQQLSLFSKPVFHSHESQIYYEGFILQLSRRPRQKSITLQVQPQGIVRIGCSQTTSLKSIYQFVSAQSFWIEKQLKEWKLLKRKCPKKNFCNGEVFPFCGELKTLKIIPQAKVNTITIKDSMLLCFHTLPSLAEKKFFERLRNFYRMSGKKILTQKVKDFEKKMQLYPSKLSFKPQRTLFGSCSEDGHISLNWTLVSAPHLVMDYIVVHELAHLKYLNHSLQFWKYVKTYSPSYLKAKKWLKTHNYQFDFLYSKSLLF